jgi:hypothetical protein
VGCSIHFSQPAGALTRGPRVAEFGRPFGHHATVLDVCTSSLRFHRIGRDGEFINLPVLTGLVYAFERTGPT